MIEFEPIPFNEKLGLEFIEAEQRVCKVPDFESKSDDTISENRSFDYFILHPPVKRESSVLYDSFILLMHGLNERSWDKYIPWAEQLAQNCGKPVVLFPIAFHINRSPKYWSDFRAMHKMATDNSNSSCSNLTFVNYALSARMKADPYRFYLSGLETINNICQFLLSVKAGSHSIFSKNAHFDIFSYSIGSLISQVMLMCNPYALFSTSKLFMFCGGSLFRYMNGDSRMIMDKDAFDIVKDYYVNNFASQIRKRELSEADRAFLAMIGIEGEAGNRDIFFEREQDRVKAVSFKKDRVIPVDGIKAALGESSKKRLTVYDPPYNYSHETPFFSTVKERDSTREYWLSKIMGEASAFLL